MTTLSLKHQRILIIAPHPDDEVFGCGGLISRCKREGGKVFVLYMTVGTTKDFSRRGVSTHDERAGEMARVTKALRIDGHRLAFPGDRFHLKLDAVPQKELINVIERGPVVSLQALRPTIVITSSPSDYNQDHRSVAQAVLAAARPAPNDFKALQPVVLFSELPYGSWTADAMQPSPNVFVALHKQDLQKKVKALRLYTSQLKNSRAPLSVRGVTVLAQLRGMQSGLPLAEAYTARRFIL